jgi:hypothetical protein
METLTPYNNLQEVFNKAYIGLRNQGWKKCTDGTRCVYDDGEGNHCAIGQCLPENSELKSIRAGIRSIVGGECGIPTGASKEAQILFGKIDIDSLVKLQVTHDGAFAIDNNMQQRFVDFAKENGLTIPK